MTQPVTQQPYVVGDYNYNQQFAAPAPYAQQQQQQLPPPMPGIPMQPVTQMMPVPNRPINCPPGLEYLVMLDQIIIQQQIDVLEAFTGYESNQRFMVKNSLGQQAYLAAEQSSCCDRYCCETLRAFKIVLLDNAGNNVAVFHRPCRCDGCCCECAQQILTIESPPGTPIGWVKEEYRSCQPAYTIFDGNKKPVLTVMGPENFVCPKCKYDFDFKLQSPDGQQIGEIRRNWPGMAAALVEADCFTARFPNNLDVRCKLALMGATFLIDFMFFDRGGGFWSNL